MNVCMIVHDGTRTRLYVSVEQSRLPDDVVLAASDEDKQHGLQRSLGSGCISVLSARDCLVSTAPWRTVIRSHESGL